MPILKCAIVDDESFAIELLSENIKLFLDLKLIKTFNDPIQALVNISKEDKIDILFLDIDMPELSGIELGQRLRDRVKYVIFTTAYSKYAIDAFRIKADDYLLKPIEKLRFIESMQSILAKECNLSSQKSRSLIFIKSNVKGKFISIKLNDITLVYVEGHKLFIVTQTQLHETSESLKNTVLKLSHDSRFLRVHNSNLINIERIVKIEGNTIEMEGNYKVPVSETYKKKLMDTLGMLDKDITE
ncbi:LytR/AlgR family response regulator transcription factor [Pedobacter psychrotolerans]|nr:LytTR family DNA-binding domain-containing protein [Pedobacter psychrotolerans]GGE51768.1 DNA-binding response regulator [Pedobacter psychrotolerans]